MIDFDTLMSPITAVEIRDKVVDILHTLGFDTSHWVTGDPEPTIVDAVSTVMADLYNSYGLQAARGGFLELAERGWLDALGEATDSYNVPRIQASFAKGLVTLTNTTTSTLGTFAAESLVFVNASTGKTYRNLEAVTILAGASADFEIIANEVGSASTAGAGDITLLTSIVGLTATNALAIFGRDKEKDADYRVRCLLSLGARSGLGHPNGFEYVALTPDVNGGVDINRVWVSKSSMYGTVDVLLATSQGPVFSGDVVKVDAAFREICVDADLVTLTTASATPLPLTLAYTGWAFAADNIDEADVTKRAAAAVRDYVAKLPIGGFAGKYFREPFESAIKKACPELYRVKVTNLADEEIIASNEVATITSASITATFVKAP